MNHFLTIISIFNTGQLNQQLSLKGFLLPHFQVVLAFSAGISISKTSLLFSLETAIAQIYFEIFSLEQQKHDAIKLIASSS